MRGSIFSTIKQTHRRWKLAKRMNGKYVFENRKQDKKTACFILAGYKEFLWDIHFDRVKSFVPEDVDVCIISSGLYSKNLAMIARNNNWSYISTERNCVTLAQNVAISAFQKAEFIFKIDEDIFVTRHFFDVMRKTYQHCITHGDYQPAFIAPLIPVNGYGHLRVLEKLGRKDDYSSLFERPIFAAGADRQIENNPDAAKFMWELAHIDDMADGFYQEPFSYQSCPIKFSIGAIYFPRQTWSSMNGFSVKRGACMGLDEADICSLAMKKSLAIVVSENSVVGHLSFGSQNSYMQEYFLNYPEAFQIKARI